MITSKPKTRSKKALIEMQAACSHLGDIRPTSTMEPEEFFELCEIKRLLQELVDRMTLLLKGGAA